MSKYRSVIFLIIIWTCFAYNIDNNFLMPSPFEVVSRMIQQMGDTSFYLNFFTTIVRSMMGLVLAFCSALIVAYLCFSFRIISELFYPILLLVRSVPNVSYIILILVWFGSEQSAMIVSFLIIFPTIYSSLYHGLLHLDDSLAKVIELYSEHSLYKLFHIYMPLLLPAVESSIANGVSLSFKVGIMAEILGQVQVGIGRQLNLCRITSDMIGIFSWTIWIIFILIVMDFLMHKLFYFIRNKY